MLQFVFVTLLACLIITINMSFAPAFGGFHSAGFPADGAEKKIAFVLADSVSALAALHAVTKKTGPMTKIIEYQPSKPFDPTWLSEIDDKTDVYFIGITMFALVLTALKDGFTKSVTVIGHDGPNGLVFSMERAYGSFFKFPVNLFLHLEGELSAAMIAAEHYMDQEAREQVNELYRLITVYDLHDTKNRERYRLAYAWHNRAIELVTVGKTFPEIIDAFNTETAWKDKVKIEADDDEFFHRLLMSLHLVDIRVCTEDPLHGELSWTTNRVWAIHVGGPSELPFSKMTAFADWVFGSGFAHDAADQGVIGFYSDQKEVRGDPNSADCMVFTFRAAPSVKGGAAGIWNLFWNGGGVNDFAGSFTVPGKSIAHGPNEGSVGHRTTHPEGPEFGWSIRKTGGKLDTPYPKRDPAKKPIWGDMKRARLEEKK